MKKFNFIVNNINKKHVNLIPTLFVKHWSKIYNEDPSEISKRIIVTPPDRKARPISEDPVEVAKQAVATFPDPPTNCCMSGCANCVWITYAFEISEYLKDGGEKARVEIEKIKDPIIKAFVLEEWKNRQQSTDDEGSENE